MLIQAIQHLLYRHLLIPPPFTQANHNPSSFYYPCPNLKENLEAVFPGQLGEFFFQGSIEPLINNFLSGIILRLALP
jgi:hypothetical protein